MMKLSVLADAAEDGFLARLSAALGKLFADGAAKTLLSIAFGCAVLLIGFPLIRFLMRRIRQMKWYTKLEAETGVAAFISGVIAVILYAELIITFCYIVGMPTASIIALLGSVGVAVGLAMQGSLSNLAGGLMLILFRPFRVGDYVIVTDNEVGDQKEGYIREITIFYTKLLTRDNEIVVLPNGRVSNETVVNCSSNPFRRINVLLSIAYEADIDRARDCLLAAARKTAGIVEDPAPEVIVSALNSSSVDLTFRAWCDERVYYDAMPALLEAGKKALDAAGVTIPFPQVDIHMK